MLEGDRKFDTPAMKQDANQYRLRVDPELHKRQSRGDMQREAQTTHTGEARWTNMDQNCYEAISSGCAIVGFFVGYGVSQGKKKGGLCSSREGEAECTIDWKVMPPLCRPDDVDAKNEKIEESRQKREAGGDTHDEVDPCNPFNADYDG